MKVSTINFAFIFLSTLLIGCGSKPASTKLKISSSFLMSNANFSGGLIIRGSSSLNHNFAVSIPVGAGTTNEATLELPKGSWRFFVAGWNGAGKFEGNIVCGEAQVNLVDDVATVDINVNQLNCNSGSFANSFSSLPVADYVANANNTVKLFTLSSCGAFYDGSTNAPIVNNDPAYYCDNALIPTDMKSRVKSFRIKAPNRTLGNSYSTGFASNCFIGGASSAIHATNVRLPTKNIPFEIEIFEDSACNEIIVHHPFLEGMEFNYPNVDKLFLVPTADRVSLHLPSNDIKKGYSPFYHLLPSFKCSGAACVTHGPGIDFYARRASVLSVVIDRGPNLSCGNYTLLPAPAGANTTGIDGVPTCSLVDDKIIANIPVLSDSTTCPDSPAGDRCWTQPTVDFRFSILKGGITTYKVIHVFQNSSIADGLELGQKYVGKNMDAPKIVDNNNGSDRHEEFYGALSSVREMLGPNGPAGLFGTSQPLSPANCSLTNGTKTITFKDPQDQQEETYKVVIGSPSFMVPNSISFFCNSSSYSVCSAPVDTAYDKKLSTYKLYGPGDFRLEMVVNFSCSTKSGVMMSMNDDFDENNERRINKDVVAWTTPSINLGYQRLEKYSSNKDFYANGNLRYEHTNLIRLQKVTADGSGDTYQADGTEYSREYTGPAIYNERANRFFIQGSSSNLAYFSIPLNLSGSTLAGTNIFNAGGAYATDRIITTNPNTNTWDFEINPASLAPATPGSTIWSGEFGGPVYQLSAPALGTKAASADPAVMDTQIFDYLDQPGMLFE